MQEVFSTVNFLDQYLNLILQVTNAESLSQLFSVLSNYLPHNYNELLAILTNELLAILTPYSDRSVILFSSLFLSIALLMEDKFFRLKTILKKMI
jgi:hypothetical protein